AVVLALRDQLLGLALRLQRPLVGLVPAVGAEGLQRPALRLAEARGEDLGLLDHRAPSSSLSTCACVRFSWRSPSSSITGAVPHDARHSAERSVKRPSCVVPLRATPSFRDRCSHSSLPPHASHESVRHTWITCRPCG